MALLGYSRLVGTTSSDSTTTFVSPNDTFPKSISTASTTTTTTTTTTHPAPPTTTPFLSHIIPLLTTTFKTLYQTHLLLFSLCFSTLTLLLVHILSTLHLFSLNLFLVCHVVLYRTVFLIKTITMETATLSWSIFWDSRKARQIRKKIEFEFFVWILGPGGNLLCFFLWPGWIVLGVMVWGLSWVFSNLSGISGTVMGVSG